MDGPFPNIIKHESSGKYFAELNNCLFKIKPIETGISAPTTIIFAFSFKALHDCREERYLFANESLSRSVSIYNRDQNTGVLVLHGSEFRTELTFNPKEWSTILIQYSSNGHTTEGEFIFNRRSGILHPGHTLTVDDDTIFIGGHPSKHFAQEAVGSFEIYFADTMGRFLPEPLSTIILDEIESRIEKEEKTIGIQL